jgi:hypothetical protein
MNPWPFVIGAYLFTLIATIGLFGASFSAMRKAEREAAELRERR